MKYLHTIPALLFSLLLAACSSNGGGGVYVPADAAEPALAFDIKTFRFTWTDVPAATHYKLLENPDGTSGFTQVGSDIMQGTQSVDHRIPLYARVNAAYILQSCNSAGCVDSQAIHIVGHLVDAIGYFKAENTAANDHFGIAVSLSGDGSTLAVGAESQNSTAADSGAVYVFTRNGSAWSQQAMLKADNPGTDDRFGIAVSLADDGNTLAVGAHFEDSNTSGVNSIPNDDGNADDSGAVYVFTRSDNIWSQQAYIKASNPDASDYFGRSLDLSGDGDTLAIGSYRESSSTTGINTTPNDLAFAAGAVYVFTRSGSSWSQQAYIKASNAEPGDNLGWSVALSKEGNTLAASANFEDSNTSGINSTPNDDGSADNSGAVYLFTRSGSSWSQQAYIKAGNQGEHDGFGTSVSLSDDGDTLAASAYFENSNSSGINSIPNDDGTAYNSGAVYVFTRSSNTWSQQAYIKANSDADDRLGQSVMLSGDGNTLAAGAHREDSSSSGINSLAADDGNADNSGAVYVFLRENNTWFQQAYIKPGNPGAGDNFGNAVALSADGNSLAAGAYLEDSNSTGINSTPNDDGTATDAGAAYVF